MTSGGNPDKHFSFKDVFQGRFEGPSNQIIQFSAFGKAACYEEPTVSFGGFSREKKRSLLIR
jgi:hypothetical protein